MENKKEKLDVKKENLRRLVVQEGGPFDMRKLVPPRPCPIVPSKVFHGIEPSRSFLFQSAMCPLKLDFYASDKHAPHQHHPYSVIYKSGDDVR